MKVLFSPKNELISTIFLLGFVLDNRLNVVLRHVSDWFLETGSYTLSNGKCSWVKSTMEFGIMNNNGKLEWNPAENKGSGYTYPDVPNGLPQETSLSYDIANCDGQLKFNPKYGC